MWSIRTIFHSCRFLRQGLTGPGSDSIYKQSSAWRWLELCPLTRHFQAHNMKFKHSLNELRFTAERPPRGYCVRQLQKEGHYLAEPWWEECPSWWGLHLQTHHVECWSHVSSAEIKDPRHFPYAQTLFQILCTNLFTSLLVSISHLLIYLTS